MLLLGAVVASNASGADRLTINLRPGGAASVGRPWSATLLVRRDGSPVAGVRVVLTARLGSRRLAATARRIARGRYRVSVRYPTLGGWRLTAKVGGATRPVGSVVVTAGPLDVRKPYGLQAERGGTLLVADGDRNRIARLDPVSGLITPVRGEVGLPIEVASGPDGSVYAVSGLRVHRISPAGDVSVV